MTNRVNHIFELVKPDKRKSEVGTLCLILVLAIGGGCGKPKATTPPPSSDSNSAAAKNITPLPGQMQTSQNGPTQLQSLNRALLGWKMKYNRRPRNFEDFASTAGFQIPAPPAGKKYALSPKGFIVLVDSN